MHLNSYLKKCITSQNIQQNYFISSSSNQTEITHKKRTVKDSFSFSLRRLPLDFMTDTMGVEHFC